VTFRQALWPFRIEHSPLGVDTVTTLTVATPSGVSSVQKRQQSLPKHHWKIISVVLVLIGHSYVSSQPMSLFKNC